MCNQTAWLIQPWEGEANRLFPSCSYEPNFRAEVWLELSWPGGTPNLNTYLARRDSEADQILGLEPVRSFALLQIPIERALDAAEPHRILPQHLVLFRRYQHPGLVGEDMPFLVRGQRAVSHNTYVRLLFAI
jgi:hypothetical protein